MKKLLFLLAGISILIGIAGAALWVYGGSYAFNTLAQRGIPYWLPVGTNSARLSPSMRLALAKAPPAVQGPFAWQMIDTGFEVADLPALVDGHEVDHILLARIDPALFRFVVRNAPAGDRDLDRWMSTLGAALVVNGSYFAPTGKPDTPFISDGVFLGPMDYDAKAGAFVASPDFTGIRDLSQEDWHKALNGAQNAMVSYPLLISNGTSHVSSSSRWLANRSFVGQDSAGRIIIGTTQDAFFSLERLAHFLADAPLDLKFALNLDGGPVACQGIDLKGFQRKTYGMWEAQVEGDRVHLLTWPYGTFELPIVLAVLPR